MKTIFRLALALAFATALRAAPYPTLTNFNRGSFIVDPAAANPTNVVIANVPFHGGAYDLPGNMIWWVGENILNSRLGYVPYLAGPTNFANSPWNVLPTGPFTYTTNKIAFNDTNYFIQRVSGDITIGTNTVDNTVKFDIPSWTGTGTRGLSDNGTYVLFGAGVGIINPTDNITPYRIDATTFGDSMLRYRASGSDLGQPTAGGGTSVYAGATGVFNIGLEAGQNGDFTGSLNIFNDGYRAGQNGIWDSVASSYNRGTEAGANTTMLPGANNIYNSGDLAGSSSIYKVASEIYNDGTYAGASQRITNSYGIYSRGSGAGQQLIATNSNSIYNYGEDAGRESSYKDSSEIYNIGWRANYQQTFVGKTNMWALGNGATTTNDNDFAFADARANYWFPGPRLNIDGVVTWGPGNTNVLYRDGVDLVITNGQASPYPGLRIVGGDGEGAIRVGGNLVQLRGVTGADLVDSLTAGNTVRWFSNYLAPMQTNAILGGTFGLAPRYAWQQVIGRTNTAQGFWDPTATNFIRLNSFIEDATGVLDIVSKTNDVDAPITGYSIRTNGVEVFNFAGGAGGSTTTNLTVVSNVFIHVKGALRALFDMTNTVWVAKDGDDTIAARGRMDRTCETITNAVALALPGDTIIVGPGTFALGTDSVSLGSVSIIGYGPGVSIITGGGSEMFKLTNSVHMANLSIISTNETGASCFPIDTEPWMDASLANPVTITLDNLHIDGVSDGMRLYGTNRVTATINNCRVTTHYDAIIFYSTEPTSSCDIHGCDVVVTKHASAFGTEMRGILLNGGTNSVTGCTVKVSDATDRTKGIYAYAGNNSISGTSITTASTTGTIYDVHEVAGNVNLTDGMVTYPKVFIEGGTLNGQTVPANSTRLHLLGVNAITTRATNEFVFGDANYLYTFPGGVGSLLQLSNSVDAAHFGFSASASAAANVIALTNALWQGRTVVLGKPGTYQINDTIYLDDGATLIALPGVILQKASAFGAVFANRGALTGVTNQNISLTGITIDGNNQGGAVAVPYGHGNFTFFWVTNLLMENITLYNMATTIFSIHFQEVRGARLSYYNVSGLDGIEISAGCQNITVENAIMDTIDDPVFVGTAGYPSYMVSVNPVTNITVRNIQSRGTGGGFALWTASWTNWASGSNYQTGDYTLNAGNIYQRSNTGTNTGTAAPVHTSGTVTGADGIAWHWIQAGTNYESSVRHVTFDNITLMDNKLFTVRDADAYCRNIYPGTENTSVCEDIEIANVKASTTSAVFNLRGYCSRWRFRNVQMDPTLAVPIIFNMPSGKADTIDFDGFIAHDLPVANWAFEPQGTATIDQFTLRNFQVSDDTNTASSSLFNNPGCIKRLSLVNGTLSNQTAIINGTPYNVLCSGVKFKNPKQVLNVTDDATTNIAVFVGCEFDYSYIAGTPLFTNPKASVLSVSTYGCHGTTVLTNAFGVNLTVPYSDLDPTYSSLVGPSNGRAKSMLIKGQNTGHTLELMENSPYIDYLATNGTRKGVVGYGTSTTELNILNAIAGSVGIYTSNSKRIDVDSSGNTSATGNMSIAKTNFANQVVSTNDVTASGSLYSKHRYENSGFVNLTDAVTNKLFEVSCAAGEYVGGLIDVTLFLTDGSEYKSHNSGGVSFTAVNKSGTITSHIVEAAQLETHVETAGTQITDTFSIQQDGASKIAIIVTPGQGTVVTPTTYRARWTLNSINGNGAMTITP